MAGQITFDILQRHLWSAVDMLRGSCPGNEARNYVLALLLMKRLSDRFDEECDALRAEGADPFDPDEHQFYLPTLSRWAEIRKVTVDLGDNLNRAATNLERANPRLEGILAAIDFSDPRKLGDHRQRDDVLHALVHHFSQIDLRDTNLSEPGMLGHAFNFLVRRTAEGDRTSPDIFTPDHLSQLMAEILQPREGMRICDPACGSGGMLIRCAQYVQDHGGTPLNLSLFGQEINSDTWAICKMNMLLNGLPDAQIARGDTLRNPALVERDSLMLFDIVLSNPPAALARWGRESVAHDSFRRFRFGVPSESRADYAFLQHMIATLNSRGRMAALIPVAALSRGGSEAQIRRRLIESDLIEAVVELPPGILESTKIAPAILIANRSKSTEKRDRILFVDASGTSDTRRKGANPSRAECYRDIAHTVQDFSEKEGFSKQVLLKEIADRDFSLRSALYLRKARTPNATEVRLDRIAEIFQGKRGAATAAEGVPVVQGRDLGVRLLSKEDLARWPAPDNPSRSVLVKEGDILLQRIGQSPKAMLAGKTLAGALVSDTVYVIRLREEHRPKAAYLVGFFNSPTGQRHLMYSHHSAVIPTLKLQALREQRIPLPDPVALDLFERVRTAENDLFERIQKALEIRSKLFEAQDTEAIEAEVRRLSVEADLLKESIVRVEDVEFQVRNFYPHMVAYGYRRLGSLSDESTLYRAQLGVMESLLAFLGSVALSLAIHLGSSTELEAHRLGRNEILNFWQRGVSLGHWMDACRNTAALLRSKSCPPAAEAFAAMWTSSLERSLKKLIEKRNDEHHQRGPKTKRALQRTVEEIGDLLREVLKESLFLVRHPIRLVERTFASGLWDPSIVHKTLVYSGDHPSLRREDVIYHKTLPEGFLYLELGPDSWLPLYPLLSIEEIDSGRCTYVIDRFDESRQKAQLKSLEYSQEVGLEHSERVGKDLCKWLDSVFRPRPQAE